MVLVSNLDSPQIDDEDRHHLSRVLRLRPGASIVLCDGRGSWRSAVFGDAVPGDAVVRDAPGGDGASELGPIESAAAPQPPIGVGFALVKGERPELIVQKLTEIGVDVILPFVAERSVVRWDAGKAERQHDRLIKVARGACMQSRRPFLPRVDRLVEFDELLEAMDLRSDWNDFEVVLADVADTATATAGVNRSAGLTSVAGPRVVLVGPEGGWTDAERDRVPGRIGLGEYVLRAETAAIAAGVVLAARRHGG